MMLSMKQKRQGEIGFVLSSSVPNSKSPDLRQKQYLKFLQTPKSRKKSFK